MNLEDYTVLDLTWLLPGPYGTMLLADMGAEVVKIEEPTRGDYARWLEPEVEGTDAGAMFHSVNRNKKSVKLDLKAEAGREAFLELAAEADAVFEQFRPGVVDRLGIGYEDVRAVNEEIVYCSLSGYGQDGPYGDRVGHDLNYVGVAGLLGETVSKDGTFPAIPAYQIGDKAGGLFSAFIIVSALLDREAGNGGQYLDVSMTDVVTSFATGQSWRAFMGEEIPESERSPAAMEAPCYDVYRTKDGKHVTVAAREEKFWERLLSELDREDLSEYRFATGEEAEYARRELQSEFERRTQAEWDEYLSEGTMFAPVNEFDEVFEHPQLRSRGMVEEMALDGADKGENEDGTGTFSYVGFPAKSSEGIDDMRSPAPGFGEHTEAVLSRVLSEERLDELEADDVI
ncbi:CoA transferase [Natronomonas sp. F2-12]|uniref:CoA transferase n=1 Tax=Natronomonas aquatica TaxID=2841590 RepID=A0A9R1CTS3_9EURY|nr:CaiB/BaiF CoA-transferase family protein [Natronomonas aquatica]MCQ4333770.1 CoA transferase [Natronomonas aquatica]